MAKYTKRQKELLQRISNLDSKLLRAITRQTSIITYQRGRTKHALTKAVKSTRSKTTLSSISDLLETFEEVTRSAGSVWSESERTDFNAVYETIYKQANENVQRFMRIMKSKGWSNRDIIIAVDSTYDVISYMASEDTMRINDLDDLRIFADEWDEGDY